MAQGLALILAVLPAISIAIGLIVGMIRYRKNGDAIRKRVEKEFEEKRSKGGMNSLYYKRPDKRVVFETFGIPLIISVIIAVLIVFIIFNFVVKRY